MSNKKITIAEQYDRIIAIIEGKATPTAEDKEFILGRKAQHTAKSSSVSKTQIANAQANESLKEQFLDLMRDGAQHSPSDFMKTFDLSNQKVTYILSQLKNEFKVNRLEIKGKVYFTIAED